MKKSLIFCIYFLGYVTLAGQSWKDSSITHFHSYESTFYIGKIIPPSPTSPKVNPSLIAELRWGYQAFGKGRLDQPYGYPEPGFSIFFGSAGNHDIYGNFISFTPNASFPLVRKPRFSLVSNLSVGFSYFTRPHDPEKNPENYLLGSHITGIAVMKFRMDYRLHQNWYVQTGLSAFHWSNGHASLPNEGMNIPTAFLGLRYLPHEKPREYLSQNDKLEKQKFTFHIEAGTGFHDFGSSIGPVGEKKYAVHTASVSISRNYSRIGRYYMGLSGRYYQNYYEYILKEDIYETKQRLRSSIFTFFLAHEFLARHVGFFVRGGINFYNPLRNHVFYVVDRWLTKKNFRKAFFQTRLGVRYYLNDTWNLPKTNIYTGFYLNTDFGQADFVEWGLGIKW